MLKINDRVGKIRKGGKEMWITNIWTLREIRKGWIIQNPSPKLKILARRRAPREGAHYCPKSWRAAELKWILKCHQLANDTCLVSQKHHSHNILKNWREPNKNLCSKNDFKRYFCLMSLTINYKPKLGAFTNHCLSPSMWKWKSKNTLFLSIAASTESRQKSAN